MTNQLRKIIKYVFLLALLSNVAFLFVLLLPPIGFVSWVSYLVFVFNILVSLVFGIIIVHDKVNEKKFMSKIKSAKGLMKAHNDILMEFYKMNKIPPQYDKNGMLRDLDSLLGIVPEYDADGNLLPNIYDILQIKPLFDQNGREIPTVLVIKHLIDKFKSKDFDAFRDITFIRKPQEGENIPEGSKTEKIVSLAKVKKAAEKPKAKSAKKTGMLITPYARYSASRFTAAPLLKPNNNSKGKSGLESNVGVNKVATPQTDINSQVQQPAQPNLQSTAQSQYIPLGQRPLQSNQNENNVEMQKQSNDSTTTIKKNEPTIKRETASEWE